jgi:hypothetical protein
MPISADELRVHAAVDKGTDFKMRSALASMLFVLPLVGPAAPVQQQDGFRPDRVQIEYVAPEDPAHRPIYDRLRETETLEQLRLLLSPFRLPRTVLLRVRGCDGKVDAYYAKAQIDICYEYLAYMVRKLPRKPVAGLTPQDALVGATIDLVLHEMGHAVFDLLQIPVLGKEEEAANLFAAYVQLQLGREDARALIAGAALLSHRELQDEKGKRVAIEDFAGVHALPIQRHFNLVCLAYGFDRELFADAVTEWRLPRSRARSCRNEYRRFDLAFKRLIMPHIDRKRWQEVQSRRWLHLAQK